MPRRREVDCVGSSGGGSLWSCSDDEAGAALGAPRSKDFAPADRAHPGAKSVVSLAADDGGLEGAFHDLSCSQKSLVLERSAAISVKVNRFIDPVDNLLRVRVQCRRRGLPPGARFLR